MSTTHPTLVERTKTLPPLGKGDHDIVLCDTLITPNRVKKPRRNILLWKKADEDGIKTALIVVDPIHFWWKLEV
jgi:hypothetical protein